MYFHFGLPLMILLHRILFQNDSGGGAKEAYIKSVPKHGDVYIQRFKKRVASAPDQVIR